jgi:N-acetylglucosamine-6-phosphate deacetylase
MRIINGRLAGTVQRDDLVIVDGLISPHGSPGDIVVDAGECIVTPGFIDLQINGAFGHDFSENPETIWDVGEMLPRYGVTSFLPTIVTSPPSVFALCDRCSGFGSSVWLQRGTSSRVAFRGPLAVTRDGWRAQL